MNAQEREQALLTIDATHKLELENSRLYYARYFVSDKRGQRWAYYYRGRGKASFKTLVAARAYILKEMEG